MKKQKLKPVLNIGCGKTKLPNSIGLDVVEIPGFTDYVHDLNKLPYPFPDNSFKDIHMYHVLEHLQNPLSILEELHRILKPGGILFIRTPHFSSMGAFTDLTHIRPFAYGSFDCLDPNHYHHFYTKVGYNIIFKKINYFGLYPNEEFYSKYVHKNQCVWYAKPFVRLINFLISLSPTFFERIWCYWVGGATEVYVKLEKIPNK